MGMGMNCPILQRKKWHHVDELSVMAAPTISLLLRLFPPLLVPRAKRSTRSITISGATSNRPNTIEQAWKVNENEWESVGSACGFRRGVCAQAASIPYTGHPRPGQ
jgi:hypothetical protein